MIMRVDPKAAALKLEAYAAFCGEATPIEADGAERV
jgi:hypothetical protein